MKNNMETTQIRSHLPLRFRSASLRAVKTHEQIDRRSLALARAIVEVIDRDPTRAGLAQARQTCAHWYRQNPTPAIAEWLGILAGEWASIRAVLLEPEEEGRRLRQSSPFCGVLSPRERWEIYRRFEHESAAA
jgi:hypothetical protein